MGAGAAAILEKGETERCLAGYFGCVAAFHCCIAVCGVGVVKRLEWARKGMLVCLGIQLLAAVLVLFSFSPAPRWLGLHLSRGLWWQWAMEVPFAAGLIVGCVCMMRLLRRQEVREEFG
jgi:hypothetical protein